MNAALLLLADSRLPAGGHAHSGSAEEAVRAGLITGTDDLTRFLRGRLATTGLAGAALAAASHLLAAGATDSGGPPCGWADLDAEADARVASPAQRLAARTQGRLLLRAARRIWPSATLDGLAAAVPGGAHHPVALGAVAAAAGCSAEQAALVACHQGVSGPATAAVRLLGLDPVAVHRVLAGLAPDLDRVAREAHTAALTAAGPPPDWAALPAHGAPALDLLAEHHLTREARLFVS